MRFLPLLLVLSFFGAQDPVPAVQAVDSWVKRVRPRAHPGEDGEVDELVANLRSHRIAHREHRRQVLTALFDIQGVALVRDLDPDSPRSRWLATVDAAAHAGSNLETVRYVSRNLLPLVDLHPEPRRAAAARWLGRQLSEEGGPTAVSSLLLACHDPSPLTRHWAHESLVGWEDEAVARAFVSALANPGEPQAGLEALAEEHFGLVSCESGSTSAARLGAWVSANLASPDWRVALRATLVAAGLPDERLFPVLITGLQTWVDRGATGGRSLRLCYACADAMAARAGRNLGPHPMRWTQWHKAFLAGQISADESGGKGRTAAGFFGLEPKSDRVVFVLDRSGSMKEPMDSHSFADRNKAHTRFDHAIDQLLEYLRRSGEDTRFNVVLFSHGAKAWKRKLQNADERTLKRLREWLKSQKPAGGTQLRHGVELACERRPDGTLDLAKLEADTVVILCDGQTEEGTSWIASFLERTQVNSRLAFHGIQIGGMGDGSLERLAKGSGGDFVIVD